MDRHVTRTDEDRDHVNRLVIKKPRLSHLHAILRSNSGAVAIANTDYEIRVPGRQARTGRTGADGLLVEAELPPGDYELSLSGAEGTFTLSTTPTHIQRRLTRLPGCLLFEPVATDADVTEPDEDEGEEPEDPLEPDEEEVDSFVIGDDDV